MLEKAYLIIKNKLWNMPTEDIIYKILDNNCFISNIAKEILLTRDLTKVNVPEGILKQVILKLSIEQLYELIINHKDSNIAYLAEFEFDNILEKAKNNYQEAYLEKVNEGKRSKLTLLKK